MYFINLNIIKLTKNNKKIKIVKNARQQSDYMQER